MAEAYKTWLRTENEYIVLDVWWYVMEGYTWDQYVTAVTGFSVPMIRGGTGMGFTSDKWVVDQLAEREAVKDWQKVYYKDAIAYGNEVVDESIQKASVASIQTNLADPRIEIGDVIWVEVPGQLSAYDKFGRVEMPAKNGIYITEISRNMDLVSGTYTATYSGYRYRTPPSDFNVEAEENYITDSVS